MRLYAPGTRKGNRYYVAKGQILGREFEVSTGQTDERAARRFAREFRARTEREIHRERAQPRKGPPATFRDIARVYLDNVRPRKVDERRLEALCDCVFDLNEQEIVFGELALADLAPMHVAAAANALQGGRANATKNREVYTPAATVLHYAADSRLCPYMRLKKLPEPKPKSRRTDGAVLPLLIENADDADLRRFLVIIYRQGWRAGETLALRWEEHVSLREATFNLYIPKAKAWKPIAMHADVLEELARVPEEERTGKVFRWGAYQSMDHHLKKLCTRLKVTFTPHQARHDFATDLADVDTTKTDIANAGSWTSDKSVGRYIGSDVKRGRDVLNRLPTASASGMKPGRAAK